MRIFNVRDVFKKQIYILIFKNLSLEIQNVKGLIRKDYEQLKFKKEENIYYSCIYQPTRLERP